MNNWISVDDGLPDKDDDYLVLSQGHISIAKYWLTIHRWLSSDARISDGQLVTHWQPLPKLPEVKE